VIRKGATQRDNTSSTKRETCSPYLPIAAAGVLRLLVVIKVRVVLSLAGVR
jgi:hypothetical protein